jgi:hypothetical protein
MGPWIVLRHDTVSTGTDDPNGDARDCSGPGLLLFDRRFPGIETKQDWQPTHSSGFRRTRMTIRRPVYSRKTGITHDTLENVRGSLYCYSTTNEKASKGPTHEELVRGPMNFQRFMLSTSMYRWYHLNGPSNLCSIPVLTRSFPTKCLHAFWVSL